jgi:excisionase family DNA binding protein
LVDGKRRIQDGPNTEFRCFSASQEVVYTNVYNLRKGNFDAIRAIIARTDLTDDQKVAEVASLLQLSTRTIYRKVQEGVLPAPVKIGDTSRWRKYEIEEWIQSGCPSSSR